MANHVCRGGIGRGRWQHAVVPVLASGVLACFAGCAAEEPVEDSVSVQSGLTLQALLPLPQNLNPSDVAVGASNGVFINDRARVEGRESIPGTATSTPYSGLVSDMGTGSMRLGVSTTVGTVLSRGAPNIANNARIQGSLGRNARS